MTETSRSERGAAKPLVIAMTVVLLTTAYVLSMGPAFRACYRGNLPFVIMKGYIPLALIGAAIPPVEKLLDDYVDSWK